MDDMRDEIRVKEQMRDLAIAEGMEPKPVEHPAQMTPADPSVYNGPPPIQQRMPGGSTVYNQNMQSNYIESNMNGSMNPRKTAYAANQHSISIIGSDIGRAHLPQNIKQPDANELLEQQ